MADTLPPSPEPTPAEQLLRHWADLRADPEAFWRRAVAGPTVAEVAARLTSAPRDFLADQVDLTALGGDVLSGREPAPGWLFALAQPQPVSRHGMALALWLLASADVVGPYSRPLVGDTSVFLLAGLGLRLAALVEPYRWLVDAERREEAARSALLWAGRLPGGEDLATARGRWDALDSLARNEALQATMTDYRHRLEVTRALREQRAREAAARYGAE